MPRPFEFAAVTVFYGVAKVLFSMRKFAADVLVKKYDFKRL